MTRREAIKKALSAVIFTGILVLILTGLSYMLRTNGSVKERFVGFYAEPKDSVDVVLIGSSPVFPYYSTPMLYGETGIVCYPLSTNLQRPAAQVYLLREALKYQDPELFIIELRMYTGVEEWMRENMAFTRGVTDNLRYSANRLDAINALVTDDIPAEDSDRYTYVFDLIKYHSNYRSLRDPAQWRSLIYAWPDPTKGYTPSTEVGPAELTDLSHVTARVPIEAGHEADLNALLDELDKCGAKALFIVSPYDVDEDLAGRYNYMGDLVTARGYDFLDLNRHVAEIGLVPEDFSDYGIHTNVCGARKVTAFLESYLGENYDLPDRRGDARYSAWQEAYEAWLTQSAADEETVAEHIRQGTFAPVE